MAASRSCLSCGYRLAGLSAARCPECGRPFDPGDCATFGVRLAHPELLLEMELEWLGEAIRVELLDAGILCVLEHSPIGVVGISTRHRVRIFVDAEDVERARDAIEQHRLEHAHLAESGAWRCVRCGEEVPGDFQRCWSCGGAAGAEASAMSMERSSTAVDPSWRNASQARRGRAVALLGSAGFLGAAGVALLLRGATGAAILVLVVASVLAAAGTVMLVFRPPKRQPEGTT